GRPPFVSPPPFRRRAAPRCCGGPSAPSRSVSRRGTCRRSKIPRRSMPFARRSKLDFGMRKKVALALFALTSCSRQKVAPAVEASAPSASAPVVAAPRPAPELSLLYTSDLRGRTLPDAAGAQMGGLARWATLVDQARLEARAVVVVDAGDFLPVSPDDG